MRHVLAAAMLWSSMATVACADGVEVDLRYDPFVVSGDTIVEIARDLTAKGPPGVWGRAAYRYRWTGSCRVSVAIVLQVPQMGNVSGLSQEDRRIVQEVLDGIKDHEDRHAEIAVEGAHALRTARCRGSDDVMAQMRAKQEAFDVADADNHNRARFTLQRVRPFTSTDRYLASGVSLEALADAMTRRGPKGRWSHTERTVTWTGYCRVEHKAHTILPRFIGLGQLSQEDRAKVDAALEAMERYEDWRVQLGADAAAAIREARCIGAEATLARFRAEEAETDRRTRNGRTQGVHLD